MDTREQEARIKVLESKVGPSAEEKEDDGFLDALKESAKEDWGGGDAAGGV